MIVTEEKCNDCDHKIKDDKFFILFQGEPFIASTTLCLCEELKELMPDHLKTDIPPLTCIAYLYCKNKFFNNPDIPVFKCIPVANIEEGGI